MDFDAVDPGEYAQLMGDFLISYAKGENDAEDMAKIERSTRQFSWGGYFVQQCRDARLVYSIGKSFETKSNLPTLRPLKTDITDLPPEIASGLVMVGSLILDDFVRSKKPSQCAHHIASSLFPNEADRFRYLYWCAVCLTCMIDTRRPVPEHILNKKLKKSPKQCLREAKRLFSQTRGPPAHASHEKRVPKTMLTVN